MSKEKMEDVTDGGFRIQPYVTENKGHPDMYSYEIFRESDGVLVDKGEGFLDILEMVLKNILYIRANSSNLGTKLDLLV